MVESGEAKCQHFKRCPLAPVGSIVVFRMTSEDREMMEARGAGESCPTIPKMVPDNPMSEGKPRAALVRGGCLISLPQPIPLWKGECCGDMGQGLSAVRFQWLRRRGVLCIPSPHWHPAATRGQGPS